MGNTKSDFLNQLFVRSEEAKRILESLKNMNQEVIASHKKTNTPLVVSIDGKIVRIKPKDL